jgi:hypothetical protein
MISLKLSLMLVQIQKLKVRLEKHQLILRVKIGIKLLLHLLNSLLHQLNQPILLHNIFVNNYNC